MATSYWLQLLCFAHSDVTWLRGSMFTPLACAQSRVCCVSTCWLASRALLVFTRILAVARCPCRCSQCRAVRHLLVSVWAVNFHTFCLPSCRPGILPCC